MTLSLLYFVPIHHLLLFIVFNHTCWLLSSIASVFKSFSFFSSLLFVPAHCYVAFYGLDYSTHVGLFSFDWFNTVTVLFTT